MEFFFVVMAILVIALFWRVFLAVGLWILVIAAIGVALVSAL